MVSDLLVDENMLATVDLIKSIAELLQYLNHSTNFFLYSLSGKTFRKETKAFIFNILKSIRQFIRNKRLKYLLKSSQQNSSLSSSGYSGNSMNINSDQERSPLKNMTKRSKIEKSKISKKYSYKQTKL